MSTAAVNMDIDETGRQQVVAEVDDFVILGDVTRFPGKDVLNDIAVQNEDRLLDGFEWSQQRGGSDCDCQWNAEVILSEVLGLAGKGRRDAGLHPSDKKSGDSKCYNRKQAKERHPAHHSLQSRVSGSGSAW